MRKAIPPIVLVLALVLSACGEGPRAASRKEATTTTGMPSTTSAPATTTTTSEAGTRVAYAAPVDALGKSTGLPVSSQASASCESGSDSVGNVEVYRCFAGNGIYDPCWADSAGGVLCMESPWATSVVHLVLSGVPPGVDVTTPDLDYPWGVQLTSGAQCLAVQGAHDNFDGKVIDYGCTGGSVSGLSLLRGVSRTTPYWTYQTVVYNGSNQVTGPQVTVTTAWFAGPAPVSAPPCQGQLTTVTYFATTPSAGMAWLIFENSSKAPCGLYGYPGVAVLDSSGNQIEQVARSPITQGSTLAEVVIPQGGAASAVLNGDPNYPNGSCPSYQDILVTPPNTTASRSVSVSGLTICADAQIDPVGVGGQPLFG